MITAMIKPVSGLCNMRCDYCFYKDELKQRGSGIEPPMSAEILEKLIKRLLRAAEKQVTLVFQGGEPTLAGLEFFKNVIRFEQMYNAKGLKILNSVQTNGLSLSDELISFFAEQHFLIGVSLDGTALTHDALRHAANGNPTYERILANTRKLIKRGCEVNVLCVVNKYAAAQPEEVFNALKEFKYIQFIPCMGTLDGDSSLCPTNAEYAFFLKRTFDLYEQGGVSVRDFDNWLGIINGYPPENCAMNGTCARSLMLESNGDAYPCDFYGTDEWKLGNLTEMTYKSLLTSDTEERFIAASLPVSPKCQSCKWYPLCRNGCRRQRDPETNVHRYCEAHISFFEYAYDRMEKLAKPH